MIIYLNVNLVPPIDATLCPLLTIVDPTRAIVNAIRSRLADWPLSHTGPRR